MVTTSSHPDIPGSADEFFGFRTKAYLDIEIDSPTLATAQALLILSALEAAHSRDSRGWIYVGQYPLAASRWLWSLFSPSKQAWQFKLSLTSVSISTSNNSTSPCVPREEIREISTMLTPSVSICFGLARL